MGKIYAIVPVYNRLQYTLECLGAFCYQTNKDFQVILVDSGSTDGTIKTVKKLYPDTKIIRGNQDWWWTQATQAGVDWVMKKAEDDDFVLLMNNDCYFGKHYLEILLKYSKKYPQTLIGSLCVTAKDPNKVVESGIRFDWNRGYVYAVTNSFSDKISAYKRIDSVTDIDALPGKGTLIPVAVFKKLGGFEVSRLPHYVADYEFTNRSKRNGFNLIVATKAIVIHHWEATGNFYRRGQDVGIKSALNLLFGRKSMNNLVDWYHFIFLACPRPLIAKNFYMLLNRVWKLALEMPQLVWLKQIIAKLASLKAILLRPAVVVYRKLNKI
jgi:GT2 family glycosyltransferase